MKNKLYIGSITAAAIISMVLTMLPYKRYTQLGIFGGSMPNATASILHDLHEGFTGDYIFLIFLAILFPMLVLAELPFLGRRRSARFFLPVQGLLLVSAAVLMSVFMTFDLWESDVEYLLPFYIALAWVLASAVFSFLLIFQKIRFSVVSFFNVSVPPGQLELI